MVVAPGGGVFSRLFTASLCAAALAFSAGRSPAALRVTAWSVAPGALDRVELASTASGSETVLWCAVHARASARFAVIVELTPEASVEAGLDAWFDALDDASAPRVLAPERSPSACGGAAAPPLDGVGQRARGVLPASTGLVDRLGLRAALEAWELPALEAAAIGLNEEGAALFAALYEIGAGGGSTETLRVRFGRVLPALPFADTPGASEIPITSYLFGAGLTEPAAFTILEPGAPFVTYRVATRSSDYAGAAKAVLAPYAGAAWLLESSIGALGEWGFYARGVAVPPLIDEYFQNAQTAGEIGTDAGECAFGAVARLTGETPPENPACGRATDLELALAGIGLDQARVTRYLALSAGIYDSSSKALVVESRAGGIVPPVVVADAIEELGCAEPPGDSILPPNPGQPSRDPAPAPEPVPVDGDYYYEATGPDVECGSTDPGSSGANDSCSSDSSSESEDCEGDTSSSDQSYGGDSCDGGDASDDYDGDSCGCDEPSGDDAYSGDTCGVSAQALGPSDASQAPLPCASVARGRKARLRLSLLTLGLFAGLLTFRRARRRRGAARAL
jgi:hypothetical protein